MFLPLKFRERLFRSNRMLQKMVASNATIDSQIIAQFMPPMIDTNP